MVKKSHKKSLLFIYIRFNFMALFTQAVGLITSLSGYPQGSRSCGVNFECSKEADELLVTRM